MQCLLLHGGPDPAAKFNGCVVSEGTKANVDERQNLELRTGLSILNVVGPKDLVAQKAKSRAKQHCVVHFLFI